VFVDLRLRPLLAAIGLLFTLGLCVIAGAAWIVCREADQIAARDSVGQIDRLLAAEAKALATANRDWARWSEGIEKFVLTPDRAYADQRLGAYAADTFGLFASFVLNPEDRLLFSYMKGEAAPDSTAVLWLPTLRSLIERARRESASDPAAVTAYLDLEGQLVLASATAMTPQAGRSPMGWARPAVLVFARPLDRTFLDLLGEAAGVRNVRRIAAGGNASPVTILAGADGVTAAALTWDIQRPSAALFERIWPVGLAMFAVMLATGMVLAGQLLRHAKRYQYERERHEAALSEAIFEAHQASRAKSQFLAHMSHELRTPLNAVIGYAEMLAAGFWGALTAKQREYVSDIEAAGRHLLSLLQDILDLAKIEAGRDEIEEAVVDVGTVAGMAAALSGARATERDVTLRVEPATPLLIKADQRRLLQMLLNLVSNALRFAPSDSAVVIDWTRREEGGVTIAVTDSGPGIPVEDLPSVIEPFHRRVDATTASATDSTGLGLALTHRLMKLHGGELHLTNRSGGGLKAELWFPAARDMDAPAPAFQGKVA
jgi:signal transduction histidine kinase